MRKEIVDHLERNEIISDVQHGFVQGESCQTQLLTVIEEWTKWMEERKPFDCLYFDYREAFVSVPHIRLMRKIENCGIIWQVQRWIKSFLQGRRQRVRVGYAVSGWKKVTSGILQGSVLGTTLFVLFINDQARNQGGGFGGSRTPLQKIRTPHLKLSNSISDISIIIPIGASSNSSPNPLQHSIRP